MEFLTSLLYLNLHLRRLGLWLRRMGFKGVFYIFTLREPQAYQKQQLFRTQGELLLCELERHAFTFLFTYILLLKQAEGNNETYH